MNAFSDLAVFVVNGVLDVVGFCWHQVALVVLGVVSLCFARWEIADTELVFTGVAVEESVA